ncbi:MAG: hypothetical protein RLZZ490_829, partial [Cyanobacteriota bacterium]
ESSLDIVQNLKQPIVANSAQKAADISTRNYIAKQIKSFPLVKQSLKIIPRSLRQKGYENLTKLPLTSNAKNPYQRPPMLPETRELLRNYFAEPNRKLSEFLERDLSFWQ